MWYVHVRLLEGHRWHGVQTAQSSRKRGWNPAIALLQTTRQTIPRKRSRSMSIDIETDIEDDFAANLYIRLVEEAR